MTARSSRKEWSLYGLGPAKGALACSGGPHYASSALPVAGGGKTRPRMSIRSPRLL